MVLIIHKKRFGRNLRQAAPPDAPSAKVGVELQHDPSRYTGYHREVCYRGAAHYYQNYYQIYDAAKGCRVGEVLQLFAEEANGRVVSSFLILFSHLLPQADVFETVRRRCSVCGRRGTSCCHTSRCRFSTLFFWSILRYAFVHALPETHGVNFLLCFMVTCVYGLYMLSFNVFMNCVY